MQKKPEMPGREALDPLLELRGALEACRSRIGPLRRGGHVLHASASEFQVAGITPYVRIGDAIEFEADGRIIIGEVVRIGATQVVVEPYETGAKVGYGHPIWLRPPLLIAPSPAWKGRVLNALARPIDGRGPVADGQLSHRVDAQAPDPLQRARVETPVSTGVRVVDIFTPLCEGQRMGIFAGSGVGKSTLLGMLARSRGFDSTIVALVGERGREVREFIDDTLGSALSNSVVVVATSDESPMMRRQAPRTAMAIAECFRNQGESVLLIIDSITRYAHALREVALAAGEPPVARGYAPSIFSELPQLLERAGPGTIGSGSITGLFSVLVDGDDHNEPISDTVRGILDGHIVLDRDVAARGQYPAVNILASISRLAGKAWSPHQHKIVQRVKRLVAEYEDTRELRMLGAYKQGGSRELELAVDIVPRLYEFLLQSPDMICTDPFAELAAQFQF